MHRSSPSILVTTDGQDRLADWLRRLGDGFDPKAIDRLLALDPQGEAGLMPRLLQAFEASLESQLLALKQAAQQEDVQACRRAAHAVRSASNSMGALTFTEACTVLERQAYALAEVGAGAMAGTPDLQAMLSQALAVLQQGNQLLEQVRRAMCDEQA